MASSSVNTTTRWPRGEILVWSTVGTEYSCPSDVRIISGTNGTRSRCLRTSAIIDRNITLGTFPVPSPVRRRTRCRSRGRRSRCASLKPSLRRCVRRRGDRKRCGRREFFRLAKYGRSRGCMPCWCQWQIHRRDRCFHPCWCKRGTRRANPCYQSATSGCDYFPLRL